MRSLLPFRCMGLPVLGGLLFHLPWALAAVPSAPGPAVQAGTRAAVKAQTKPIVQKPKLPPVPAVPSQPPACAAGDLNVTLLETESDIKCDADFSNCAGELQLAARNCTGGFQTFVRVELYEGPRRIQVLEFKPAPIAPPNTVWRESIPWNTPAELSVEVFYHPPGQDSEQSVRGPLRIVNKALMAAKEACQKCQGVWGRFGVNKLEACNCKTSDAGKTCSDGDDCQGYCLFQRYDSDGREEGLCSETQRLVGCYGIIFHGASKMPPVLPPPRKRTTCVD